MYHASVGICRDLLYQLGPKGVLDKRSCMSYSGQETAYSRDGARYIRITGRMAQNYTESPLSLEDPVKCQSPFVISKGEGTIKGKLLDGILQVIVRTRLSLRRPHKYYQLLELERV